MEGLVNLIPIMTSDTAPSGIARASAIYDNNYRAWKAFDKESTSEATSAWLTPAGITTGWLEYEFDEPVIVNSYGLYPRENYERTHAPNTWTFEGSNNGVDYDVLDSRSNETDWVFKERKKYDFENSVPYKMYRINITKNDGYATYTAIQELEMFFEGRTTNKILLLSEDERYIVSYTITGEVPEMSSNISPLGQVSTSNNRGNAWRVFNKTNAGSWDSGWNGRAGDWLSYEFEIPVSVYKYTIQSASNYLTEAPNHFMLEGSNDGVSWVSLHEQESSPSWIARETREYVVRKSIVGKYKSYRLRFLSTKGSDTLSVPRINFLYKDSWMIEKSDGSEKYFINHGMSPQELSEIDFWSDFTEKHYIQNQSTPLGLGKVFEQSLDVDKIIRSVKIE